MLCVALTLRCVSSILQPGFFLENFEGLIGAITITFFRQGLHEDTALAVIVSCLAPGTGCLTRRVHADSLRRFAGR